ncbi:hypothetical protein IID21_00620 [Patescibacteria group bacterium]|nr:hypothetical protein [Patescibacteria group bacterium]
MKRLFFLATALLIIAVFYFVLPRAISISEISCQSQYGPCNQKIVDVLKTFEGENLYQSLRQVKSALSSNELVSDFSTQFKLPNKIKVIIIERKPRFALTNQKAQGFALVDRSGAVLRIEDSSSLPYVVVAHEIPNVGEIVTDKQLFALNIIYDIFSLYRVKEGMIEDDSLRVSLIGGPKVIFPLKGDRQILLASLGLILDKLNEGSGGIRINENELVLTPENIIDLRFKNPILR